MIKRKTLFLVFVGIFMVCFFSAPKGLLARPTTKQEPTEEIKQIYNELKLKISELKKKTDRPVHLKNVERKIKVISSLIENVQPEIVSETIDSRTEIEMTPSSRALISKKRDLQTEIHTADIPLEASREELVELLEKKEKLESEYLLLPIEISLLSEATSALNRPIIIIEGQVELKRADDIFITLSLAREVAATVFCEVHLNNIFIRRERWKIGSKQEFKTKLISSDKVTPSSGLNDLMIVLNTDYQDDDVKLRSPSFQESPLTVFAESNLAARNIISASFKLKEEEEEEEEEEDGKETEEKEKKTEEEEELLIDIKPKDKISYKG